MRNHQAIKKDSTTVSETQELCRANEPRSYKGKITKKRNIKVGRYSIKKIKGGNINKMRKLRQENIKKAQPELLNH